MKTKTVVKFFIKNKIKESLSLGWKVLQAILILAVISLIVISLMLGLGHLADLFVDCSVISEGKGCNDCGDYIGYGGVVLMTLFFGAMIIGITLTIIKWFIKFIKDNWELAKIQARDEKRKCE